MEVGVYISVLLDIISLTQKELHSLDGLLARTYLYKLYAYFFGGHNLHIEMKEVCEF